MNDPHFDAIMHGEILSKEKSLSPLNRYELEYQKSIRDILDSSDGPNNTLLPKHLRQAQKEAKIKESLELPELYLHLEEALKILAQEGERYLGLNDYTVVQQSFNEAIKILDTDDLKKIQLESIGKTLSISSVTTDAIFKIALDKFDEKAFPAALSLITLLAVFYPDNFEYWYRSGIISQLLENYDYALKAYAIAYALNEKLIGARVFSTECYLKLGQTQEAIAELKEAQRMAEEQDLPKEWSSQINELKQNVNFG